jgi:hypothetical protein
MPKNLWPGRAANDAIVAEAALTDHFFPGVTSVAVGYRP